VQRSEGVWRTAWRRFKGDRVAMTSLVVVLAFILLIVAAATGMVASQWQRELAVPNAPPTFLGPRAGENTGTLAGPEATPQPPVDLSDIDPLAPRYKEWAERAAKLQPFATGAEAQPKPNDGKRTTEASVGRVTTMVPFDHAGLIRELAAKCLASESKQLTAKPAAEFDRCFVMMQLAAHSKGVDTLAVFRSRATPGLAKVLDEGTLKPWTQE
jgi:hypothetical protein